MFDRRVVVRRDRSRRRIDDDALVLSAAGIPFEVQRDGGYHSLVVPAVEMARALDKLDLSDAEVEAEAEEHAEIARHDRATAAPGPRAHGLGTAIAYVAAIAVIHLLDATGALGVDLGWAGVSDARRVRAGEWWRAVTALTLHVDAVHVVANAVFGGLFLALLARALGSGVAWALFLASGALGNAINALLQDPSHLSVGASTSVFGALAALGAFQWTADTGLRLRWTRRFAPFVMSVVLLTFLGAGSERTDVLAHVTGFVAGWGLGLVAARLVAWREPTPRAQWALAVAVALTVAACWVPALVR